MSFYGKKRISHQVTPIYILVTVVLALVITLILSPWNLYLPNFLLLVITWWIIREPNKISFLIIALLGLFNDIICDRVMGVSMAQFIIVAFLTFNLRFRLQLYTFLQQTFAILAIFILAFALPFNFANFLVGQPQHFIVYWQSIFSALIWIPFVLVIVLPQYRPIKEEATPHQSI